MAGEVVHGLTMRLSAAQVAAYPELEAAAVEGLLANLAGQVAADGLQMLEAPHLVKREPVAFVKVNHHAHGWQMSEVQVSPEDAEQWFFVAEVACAPK